MSLRALHADLLCDGCGHWRRAEVPRGGTVLLQSRRLARAAGWTTKQPPGRPRIDLCPACRHRDARLARITAAARERKRVARLAAGRRATLDAEGRLP